MFEFDSPALQEAVTSTLKDPDPGRAISPSQFFATHLGDAQTVTPFDDVLETFHTPFRDSLSASGEGRLVRDVQTFRELVDACHASPHREIRAAPASYVKKAVDAFIRDALAVTPEEQRSTNAEALRDVQEYYEAQRGSDVEAARGLLSAVCEERCFSPEIRAAFHEFGLSIVALESGALFKADSTAGFARTVPGLPANRQLEAFRLCLTLDQNTPADAARHLLDSCALSLDTFDRAVGGKAAIEVVKAAGKYGDPEALKSVMYRIEDSLVRRNPYANGGRSYFDSVPVDDRVEYFAKAMQAALGMPGFDRQNAVSMGLRIVDRVLPDGVVDLAKDALYKAGRGDNVDFQAEAQSWRA